MSEGLSTNRNCETFGDCLVQAGRQFVVRYHSARTVQPQKRLSPREAALLARAGLDLVTVYQDRARETADFGRARGLEDGRAAFAFAGQVGQPPGSAVYFAVDTDFSKSQIASVVLPYFEAVREALAPVYRVGIYGSGLACQLVKENHALADLSWLAMASGWRGSAAYQTWDLRQSGPTGPLCALGTAWERNEGRGDFGAFRPIGAELTADEGVPMRVTAAELFLRSVPTKEGNQPMARLRHGQLVRVLGDAAPPWKRVRATVDGGPVIGFASGRFLAPADTVADVPPPPPPAGSLPTVHFREHDPESRRGSTGRRAQPLGEDGSPGRPNGTPDELQAIIDWLAVDTSARWQRTPDATFCNVYAADFCYLAGVYLPRVWWKGSALMQIAAGVVPPVVYDGSVREMRADDLLAWLIEFGPTFGWRRVFDASALQAAANAGGAGLVCADRDAAGRPGHITVVVPESPAAQAVRDPDGHVLLPVQSQAGAVNFRRGTAGRAWWDDAMFRDRGFFVHD